MPSESNPSRHRDFSAPVPQELASAALSGFLTELMELRNKFRIPDVHVVVRVNCINPEAEGGESAAMTTAHYGDTMLGEEMSVWAASQAQAERARLLNNMAHQGRAADARFAEAEQQQVQAAQQPAAAQPETVVPPIGDAQQEADRLKP